MPFQITISDKENRKIIVSLRFSTLNTWSYDYVTYANQFHCDSESVYQCHVLGLKEDLLYKSDTYDITLTNLTDQIQDFNITVIWYMERTNNDEIPCNLLDNEQLFEVLSTKEYTGTLTADENNINIYETITYV